jgi:asparagine synthase (glutamine-hydrolysing)
MQTIDGRYTITFNGEIYNYQDIKNLLIKKGYKFKTNSDTEVLLHGWDAWNDKLLDKVDGMFAFAIYDKQENIIILARDRIGIKPLFYSSLKNGLIFSSTLSPFFKFPDFPRKLNYSALRDYLASQTCYSPDSILEDVYQLPPASLLCYDKKAKSVTIKNYWSPPLASKSDLSLNEAIEKTDFLLKESVRRQTISDVPIGAFLSGGIDSSLMVHYLSNSGVSNLRTFNMRFKGFAVDETPSALSVSNKYGTNHNVIDVSSINSSEFISAIKKLDQPLADPAYVTTSLLSKETSKSVKVCISGDGGDEIFGGYPRFFDTEDRYPKTLRSQIINYLVAQGIFPGKAYRRALTGKELLYYKRVELGPYPKSRKDFSLYLNNEALSKCDINQTLSLWKSLLNNYGEKINTEALMKSDIWTYLSENCLVKTDRASMAYGLEVRVPFLGNPLLDEVLNWHSDLHINDKNNKIILRNLAIKNLPKEVWDRPKQGFSVPLKEFFNNQWSEACEHYINQSDKLAPIFNTSQLLDLWSEAKKGKSSRRLMYTFIVLLIWLEENKIDF